MTMARSRTFGQLGAAVSLTGAVAWMFAPTYRMTWAALTDPNPVSLHSWLDPLVWGYGGFHAPVTVLCGVVAAIGAWIGGFSRRVNRFPAWWALAGALVFVSWAAVLGHIDALQVVPLLLLAAGAAGCLMAAHRALPDLVSGPAAR